MRMIVSVVNATRKIVVGVSEKMMTVVRAALVLALTLVVDLARVVVLMVVRLVAVEPALTGN
jgi:hypothetical protein